MTTTTTKIFKVDSKNSSSQNVELIECAVEAMACKIHLFSF